MPEPSEIQSVKNISTNPSLRTNYGLESTFERLSYILQRILEIVIFNLVYMRSVAKHLRHLGTRIGSNCALQNRVIDYGSEPWLIEIGNNVTIGEGAVLITHDGSSRLFRDKIHGMNRYGNKFGTIIIHDNSFVGINAIILPGVVIGPNAIIGTGSVVTKTVSPNTVVAGNPARIICTLDEYIERYQKKMLPLHVEDRISLRKELTSKLWGQER